jgi:hypothetical protein
MPRQVFEVFIESWWKQRFPTADPPKWDSAITCADATDLLRKFYDAVQSGEFKRPCANNRGATELFNGAAPWVCNSEKG